MFVLIIGTPDSGKSERAERLISDLAGENSKFYIATMIPYGEEGTSRVEKHRAMRAGKGFETIECPNSIHLLKGRLTGQDSANILLECISNLVGNEMYHADNKNLTDAELVDYIIKSVYELSTCAENIVVVTNEFEVEDSFDEETIRYVRLIHEVNVRLRELADRVDEIIDGSWYVTNDNKESTN